MKCAQHAESAPHAEYPVEDTRFACDGVLGSRLEGNTQALRNHWKNVYLLSHDEDGICEAKVNSQIKARVSLTWSLHR